MIFHKVKSFGEILIKHFNPSGMQIIDVGCGTGELVRFLTSKGGNVIGVDSVDLIEKAKCYSTVNNEKYLIGTAQDIYFEESSADLIIFFASFHHIPEKDMHYVIGKFKSILRSNGHLVFLEPLKQKDSYYELAQLIDDESEVQLRAYNHILSAIDNCFHSLDESYYFVDRSFNDFENLVNNYVKEDYERDRIFADARKIVLTQNKTIETSIFPSYARLNILKKSS